MIDYLVFVNSCYNQQVVGPYAQEANEIYGDYSPLVSRQFTTTVAEGLVKLGSTVIAASGCNGVKCMSYSRDGITDAVQGADLVVVALGTGSAIESEGNDRADISLPGRQFEVLLDAVRLGEYLYYRILAMFLDFKYISV